MAKLNTMHGVTTVQLAREKREAMAHARTYRWKKKPYNKKRIEEENDKENHKNFFKYGVLFFLFIPARLLDIKPVRTVVTLSILSFFIYTALFYQPQLLNAYQDSNSTDYGTNYPQAEVINDSLATPQPQAAVEVPFPTLMQDNKFSDYIKSVKNGPIIYRQWQLESNMGTKGHAVSCRTQGLFNDFGLAVYGSTYTCYPTFEASVDAMSAWWNKWGTEDLDRKLCIYNKGPNSAEAKAGKCEYSINFHNL